MGLIGEPGVVGVVTGPGGSVARPDGGTPPPSGRQPLQCTTPSVGPSPMRRLSHLEYDNTVRDLLGDTTRPASAFPPDQQVGIFNNTALTQTVPVLLAEGYADAAERLATHATRDVPRLIACDPAARGESTCAREFIARFGRRAYRRPLAPEESTRLVALYDAVRAASDFATAIRGIVQAVLVSPHFLFRPEFGAGAGSVPAARELAPYELASRLSFLIWSSAPDDALLDAAAAGQLETREQVATQARRLLADPRARPAVAAFYEQWLHLERLHTTTRSPEVYPTYNDALRDAMGEETARFVDDVVWSGDARLATLLTASYSFVNGPLAALYGVTGPGDAATFRRVTFDPAQRAGVLTHASVLAVNARPDSSSPIKRGEFVRVRLLCHDLPSPPNDIPPLPAIEPGVSTRERFAMHASSPACRGCHQLIDGLGFGFEQYDAIGRFRTTDQGVAVDARGEVVDTRDLDGAYTGVIELARRLAGSEQVRDCVATQWFRYASARRETDDDTCSLVELQRAFARSGGDLRELMVSLTQTDTFLQYRRPE